MKKLLMLNGVTLLLAGLLILAGCPSDGGGSSESESSVGDYGSPTAGVLGQISGVVYNSVTAQPIKGVSVQLGGKVTVKTDQNGGFLFKNVEPGTYTVSFYSEGFQFRTKNVVVDANAYTKDDPFYEVQALKEQLVALHDWVATQKKIPDYNGFGSTSGALTWTYQDGVYIDGNNAAVTIKNEGGQFVIEPIKLNYSYSKGIPLYITNLAPLTGAIQTNIKLFTKPYGTLLNEKLDEPIDIDDGVEFWLVEPGFIGSPDNIGWGLGSSGNGQQPEYPNTPNNTFQAATGGAVFGPATTKNGVLLFTGLPVDIPLELVNNGFVKKGTSYFYKFKTDTYQYSENNGTPLFNTVTTFKAQNNSVNNNKQNYTNIGPVYLFTEGSFAVITDTDTGTPVAPKKTTEKISLTFSEPIDTSTFAAILQLTANAASGAGELPLASQWVDETTVNLSPAIASALTGGLMQIFPRASSGTLPIGTLRINGRAQSGAKILAVTTGITGIPVFTEESIKLIGVDISPTDIPGDFPRTIVSGIAIKLVFNKEINGDSSRFWLGTSSNYSGGQPVEFYLSGDEKSVFVRTNLLTYTPQQLNYNVVSKVDPSDSTGNQTVSDTFENGDNLRLVLRETSIYNGGYVSSGGADAHFLVDNPIILTFDKNIPFTSDYEVREFVKVSLAKTYTSANTNISGNSISLSKSVNGKTLTIQPTVPLELGITYYLDVQISKVSEIYFQTSDLVNLAPAAITTNGINTNIIFKTEDTNEKTVSARSGNNSSTSSVFTTVTANAITGGNLKVGTLYYVQFDGDLDFTATDLTATVIGSDSTEISFAFEKKGTDILQIKVVAASGDGPWTNVALKTPIDGNFITTGTFTISNLYVQK